MLETYPPFCREDFLSGSDSGRDRVIVAGSGLEWLRHLPALSGVLRTILGRDFAVGPDSRTGLIIGDFDPVFPPKLVLRRGTLKTIEIFFFHDLFLSELDYGLVSLRRACYRLVLPFSIPVDSPRDKRGRSCFGNRGLRFLIRADNGRFTRRDRHIQSRLRSDFRALGLSLIDLFQKMFPRNVEGQPLPRLVEDAPHSGVKKYCV
jgi:hypothetical protein